jgi:hypothetical protein
MEAGARRRGPKPRGQFEDKRFTLTTRITESTRKRLEAAVANSGRSLSQEIELRLDQSFRDDVAWGGARTKALLQILASMSQLHGPYSHDDDWLKDKLYFNEVLHKWYQYFENLRLSFYDADKEERRKDIEEYSKLIESASPEMAAMLRRRAKEMADYGHLDPDERAQWALLGEDLAEKSEGEQ